MAKKISKNKEIRKKTKIKTPVKKTKTVKTGLNLPMPTQQELQEKRIRTLQRKTRELTSFISVFGTKLDSLVYDVEKGAFSSVRSSALTARLDEIELKIQRLVNQRQLHGAQSREIEALAGSIDFLREKLKQNEKSQKEVAENINAKLEDIPTRDELDDFRRKSVVLNNVTDIVENLEERQNLKLEEALQNINTKGQMHLEKMKDMKQELEKQVDERFRDDFRNQTQLKHKMEKFRKEVQEHHKQVVEDSVGALASEIQPMKEKVSSLSGEVEFLKEFNKDVKRNLDARLKKELKSVDDQIDYFKSKLKYVLKKMEEYQEGSYNEMREKLEELEKARKELDRKTSEQISKKLKNLHESDMMMDVNKKLNYMLSLMEKHSEKINGIARAEDELRLRLDEVEKGASSNNKKISELLDLVSVIAKR